MTISVLTLLEVSSVPVVLATSLNKMDDRVKVMQLS